ncbi:hypothetical protein ACFL6S_25940 [Candidatus Poribacteria bacterium]
MLKANKAIAAICILGIALSILLSGLYFRFSYFEPDTVSYSFQAKLFARGKLAMDAPPEHGFSSSPHINVLNGKWYSKYPFGNALMLTLGEFVNAHWLIPALVTGFALVLLYLIVREVYGHRIATIAAVLGLISPATLGMGCTWFSEPVSRFYLAIFLLALILTLKRDAGEERRVIDSPLLRVLFPVLSGFALGYAFNTRPIPAVAFGVAGGCLALYWILHSREKAALIRATWLFFIPFVLMMALCMAWNAYFTGNPLKLTHNAAQPYDKMGFGKRTESYDPNLENAFVFTPKYALDRIWRHTLPCISFNTLGWGYYRPSLFQSYYDYTNSVVAGVVAKSYTDEDWITLKFWGRGTGGGRIQFHTRGNGSSPGLTDAAPGFSCSDGQTDLAMRLVKEGDQYTGYFKTERDIDWIQVGPASIPLTPPLEVGIYAGINLGSGKMKIEYQFFRVNSDSSAELISDDFTGAPDNLKPQWRWSREPAEWTFTKSGLNFQPNTNSNLHTEDTATRLSQFTSADSFDIETRFSTDWRIHESWLTVRAIPLALVFIFMLIPLFHPSRNRYDVLFLGLLLINLLLYFFFYFDGSTWGITPVNARYYTECTLLGIIPLVARGMFIFYGWVRRIPSRLPLVPIVILLALLGINTVYTYVLIGRPYRNWGHVYQKLPRLVKEQEIHRAVVFVPQHRGAPIGDYPFESLEEADIVYFKLGPSKAWKLTNSDWRSVYEKYFKGRRAYMYEGGGLKPLIEDNQ